jgi:hypothetical protein
MDFGMSMKSCKFIHWLCKALIYNHIFSANKLSQQRIQFLSCQKFLLAIIRATEPGQQPDDSLFICGLGDCPHLVPGQRIQGSFRSPLVYTISMHQPLRTVTQPRPEFFAREQLTVMGTFFLCSYQEN